MSHSSGTVEPRDVATAVADGVSRLVTGGLSDEEWTRRLDALVALYADPTDVRHPFAPTGVAPLRTHEDLRRHFRAGIATLADVDEFTPVDATVHETGDPEVVVHEFAYAVARNGHRFRVPNIFVMRIRDGRIVESRDYAHHVALARGLGTLDTLADALVRPA